MKPGSGPLADLPVDQALLALIDFVPEAAIFLVDADRTIRYWSRGAERLLGFSQEEVTGAHCLKGIRCPRCLEGCGLERHRRIEGAQVVCHRKDGQAVTFRKYAQAFIDPAGGFAGGIEVLIPDRELLHAEVEAGARSFHGMMSRDPAMFRAFETIRNAAQTEATVLIRGESGTGKELAAQAIHSESHRRGKPFVAVNCAALTPSLIESELFGHVRGSFTGASSDRQGIFAQADGGTLFLDEVAELPMDLQARLLRVLQERTFTPVGSSKPVRVDVRVVAATHRALRAEVKAGRFREDLMFRLRVVPIFLPPLRERRTDVDLLLHHLIRQGNARGPRRVQSVAPEAMRLLLDWRWPGNVRELQNVVAYAFAVGRSPEITLEDLPPEFREAATARDMAQRPDRAQEPYNQAQERTQEQEHDQEHDQPHRPPLEPSPGREITRERLDAALRQAGDNVGEAARLLGVSRPTFWRWRKKYV